jgi:hypothetical protein
VKSPGSRKSGNSIHHDHAQKKKLDQAREQSLPAAWLHGVEYIPASAVSSSMEIRAYPHVDIQH